MQVYRDLRILTARPTPEEEAQAPHRLYGNIDGAENYSVGRYLVDAADVLAEIRQAGRLPIFVGGTGLYFKALTDGLSEIPPVPNAVRDRIRAASEGRATPELHAALSRRDPETAAQNLRPNDRLRILRALEVLEATGRPLASFRGQRRPGPLAGVPLAKGFPEPGPRGVARAHRGPLSRHGGGGRARRGAGARERAGSIRRFPSCARTACRGSSGISAGELTLDEAIARGQADTRRYAKRQFTWFRHQMPGWTWVAPEEAEAVIRAALAGQ